MITAGQGRTKKLEIQVLTGQTVTQDVSFSGGATVSGTVSGIPQSAHCGVAIFEGDITPFEPTLENILGMDSRFLAELELDEHGAFRFEGLEPGHRTIIAVAYNPGRRLDGRKPPPWQDVNPNTPVRVASATLNIEENGEYTINLRLAP